MTAWRKLTVITFHNTPRNQVAAASTATAGHDETRPTATVRTPLTPTVTASDGPGPIRREIPAAAQPPSTPPTAGAALSTANSVVDVPSTSWRR